MAITPNKAQIEAAGLEYIEPTEIVADTGPKALNLLAQAVVDGLGGVDEAEVRAIVEAMNLGGAGIPIFATLAEAEAYEAANPGKTALTIESVEPDTAPPTLGTMTITPEGTKATAVVSGAKDDRGSVEYSFKLDSGAWTAWQSEARYTFTGLSLSTSYSAMHRVRDRAGNTVEGYSQSFTTLAEDMWGTLWVDSFANNPDGSISGAALDSPSSASWAGGLSMPNNHNLKYSLPSVTGGVIKGGQAAYVDLPSEPMRVSLTITASGGGVNRAAWPILGGTADNAYDYLDVPNVTNRALKWTHVTPESTSYLDYEVQLKDDSGASINGGILGAAVEQAITYDLDLATGLLVASVGGKERLRWTVPAEKLYGGTRFGFHTGNLDLAGSGSLSSWSIRWE